MNIPDTADNGEMITRRPDRGLTIAGTRITLYTVMEYLKQGYPTKFIRDWFNLTDAQVAGALDYIAANREQVEAEYEQVVREAEEDRRYHEERNKEVSARIRSVPVVPGKEAFRAKLLARKAQTEFKRES